MAQARYQHTQVGRVMLVTLGLAELWTLYSWARTSNPSLGVLAGFLLLLILGFYALRVEVTEDQLRFRFGIGLLRKSIPLSKICSVRPVKNRPWWGWGIRYLGRGWLYNVSGLQAVEVELSNGRRLRLGTDEPEALARVLQSQTR